MFFLQAFLGGIGIFAPDIFGIVEFNAIAINIDIEGLVGLALEDNGIESGPFQFNTPMSAHSGSCHYLIGKGAR